MAKANTMGRMDSEGNPVWIIGTPHFEEQWESERFGKSKSVSLSRLTGYWKGARQGFYEAMLDAPIDETFYAVIRSKKGKKPCAFIYFRNIENETRGGRRELELISVTPPIRGQTEGFSEHSYCNHSETQQWCEVFYRWS